MLEKIVQDSLVCVDLHVKDWKEAIKKSALLLLNDGDITASYIDGIFESVKEFGPYFVIAPHVALAHAPSEDGAKKLALGVTILATPVNFHSKDNDPVKYIFTLSSPDSSSHLEAVMPQLVKKFPDCYKGYTLYQLCQEMHQYYKQNHIFELERDLFLKTTFQDYVMKPGQADFDFNENKSQLVELDNLKGRIALEGALPYPPGVFIVAPGEKWQQIDIDYFKILLGAAATFPGFEPEVQGVYKDSGKIVGEVLRK